MSISIYVYPLFFPIFHGETSEIFGALKPPDALRNDGHNGPESIDWKHRTRKSPPDWWSIEPELVTGVTSGELTVCDIEHGHRNR